MTRRLTRRRALQTAALAAASAALPLPFTRGAFAAGRLAVAAWDHPVPGANAALSKLANDWAKKENIDLTLDFVTTDGDRLMLVAAAEGEAKAGHDVIAQPGWYAAARGDEWLPADDLMANLTGQYGPADAAVDTLGKQGGHWIAVPAIPGSQNYLSVARLDVLKDTLGLDPGPMYPATGAPDATLADQWNWDFVVQAAGKSAKAGKRFTLPLGRGGDAANWVGAVFAAYGAALVDKDGNVAVKSDATRQVLDFFKKLVPLMPTVVFSWGDADAGNALAAGKTPYIVGSPMLWALATSGTPQAGAQFWHFPLPKGPKGRFDAAQPAFWGIWKFSPNQSAAQSLMTHLWAKDSVQLLVAAGKGCDLPAFASLHNLDTWTTAGPPPGTLANYPPRGDVVESVTGAPAPAALGRRLFASGTMTGMIAQYTQHGKTLDQTLDWAAKQIEGFKRS
ncbi:MAG: ABC transporter substrate-binding protein [Stellaceae bacterium]